MASSAPLAWRLAVGLQRLVDGGGQAPALEQPDLALASARERIVGIGHDGQETHRVAVQLGIGDAQRSQDRRDAARGYRPAPGTRPGHGKRTVGSCCISLAQPLVQPAHAGGIRLLGGIEVAQPPQVILARRQRGRAGRPLAKYASTEVRTSSRVVGQVGVGETAGEALLAAGEAPDERPVARVVFSDAGLCSITCGPFKPRRASRVTST
ncbi:Uncharacterised protein [Pseudomonas aeruginosa]|nr:Uncharacterised protein [Pseudomonas aeruginosa]